jgi:hypothetical protein
MAYLDIAAKIAITAELHNPPNGGIFEGESMRRRLIICRYKRK